jgi:ABC-type multidrug transport system fused ATPase/permease subunit
MRIVGLKTGEGKPRRGRQIPRELRAGDVLHIGMSSALICPTNVGAFAARNDPPADWPSYGRIELKNITVAYRYLMRLCSNELSTNIVCSVEASNTALNNICLKIEAGEKIGICGQSGW